MQRPGVAGPDAFLCDGHGPASSQRGLTADARGAAVGRESLLSLSAFLWSVNNRIPWRLLKCCIQPEGATGQPAGPGAAQQQGARGR